MIGQNLIPLRDLLDIFSRLSGSRNDPWLIWWRFKMSSGNPLGFVSFIIGSGKCVWKSCQKNQKAAGWGFVLHVLDYWKSLPHKYDTLWRQTFTPQFFGSSDINFKHRFMIIWWKYIALGGCPKRFKHFGQKLPSYYICRIPLIYLTSMIEDAPLLTL